MNVGLCIVCHVARLNESQARMLVSFLPNGEVSTMSSSDWYEGMLEIIGRLPDLVQELKYAGFEPYQDRVLRYSSSDQRLVVDELRLASILYLKKVPEEAERLDYWKNTYLSVLPKSQGWKLQVWAYVEFLANKSGDVSSIGDLRNIWEYDLGTTPTTRSLILDTPIEELDLSSRTYKALLRAGILTVRQILGKTDQELLHVRNFGKASLEEIRERLSTMGVQEGAADPELAQEPAHVDFSMEGDGSL